MNAADVRAQVEQLQAKLEADVLRAFNRPAFPAGIRWVPIHPATTFWRVYRGQRQLGHVALACNGRAWQASHIEPGGRRLVQPCATLQDAAIFAVWGHSAVCAAAWYRAQFETTGGKT